MPTAPAPAAMASSALAPAGANTATRTVLPVPCGSTVEPRTCWSDLRASTPRRTATSTASTNFALLCSLTIFSASSIGYALPGCTASRIAFCRLVSFAMSSALHRQAHRTGRALDGAHRRVQVGRGQVGFLRLRDLFQLGAGDLAHLLGVRTRRTGLHAGRLLQQNRRRRGLGDEGEGAVRVRGDHGRDRQARFHLLRGGVERLAEFHDVQAALAQGGADRRARIGLPGWHLQLDVADYFLCHCWTPASANACSGLLASGGASRARFQFTAALRRSAWLPRLRPSRPVRIPARP